MYTCNTFWQSWFEFESQTIYPPILATVGQSDVEHCHLPAVLCALCLTSFLSQQCTCYLWQAHGAVDILVAKHKSRDIYLLILHPIVWQFIIGLIYKVFVLKVVHKIKKMKRSAYQSLSTANCLDKCFKTQIYKGN